jgi:cytochrome c oxidase assembly protein subunit 20
MYQYCQYKRQMEKEGMTRDMQKKAREARREKIREERRKNKDQEQDAQIAALAEAKQNQGGKSWWKVW